jgi:hypothetical protein
VIEKTKNKHSVDCAHLQLFDLAKHVTQKELTLASRHLILSNIVLGRSNEVFPCFNADHLSSACFASRKAPTPIMRGKIQNRFVSNQGFIRSNEGSPTLIEPVRRATSFRGVKSWVRIKKT